MVGGDGDVRVGDTLVVDGDDVGEVLDGEDEADDDVLRVGMDEEDSDVVDDNLVKRAGEHGDLRPLIEFECDREWAVPVDEDEECELVLLEVELDVE